MCVVRGSGVSMCISVWGYDGLWTENLRIYDFICKGIAIG